MLGTLLFASILSLGVTPINDQATMESSEFSFQQAIFESGAELAEEAIRACEKRFGREIQLPPQVPAVAFTHQYGRCYGTHAGLDEHLEIHYRNEFKPENDYRIELYPVENRQQLEHLSFQALELTEQTTAKFYKGPLNTLQLLVFEKADWQYLITTANRASTEIGQRELTDIAQSLIHAVNRREPAYAKWGTLAVTETKRKYNMDVVDYLYMGRTKISSVLAEEKFKLWLKKGNVEFGVYVTVSYHPVTDQILSIRYEEI
ncbi:YqzG/YhdC family protein [Paenibacillus lautus]|uniref:YqzG/YhdC family protein n=1 Tax=Bacillales TaxID=1385 RepID=UPI0020413845|nr:YqzG/YhdC family protein [Paenibacillus lautus]MCM3257714.1 YqzG/YhdC family protein [Paenibacillus lautus]